MFSRGRGGDTFARRITILVLGIVTTMALVAIVVSALVTQRLLVASLDRGLLKAAAQPASSVRELAESIPAGSAVLYRHNDRTEIQAVQRGQALSERAKQQLMAAAAREGRFSMKLDGFDDVRVRVDHMGNDVRLVARSLEQTEQDIIRLAVAEAAAWIVAAVLASIGGVFLGRRIAAPLSDVVATAQAVSQAPVDSVGDAVRARVPTNHRAVTEVEVVKDSVNGLLGHVERALQQRDASEAAMRKFLADVSHDLRTPIAVVRSHAELSQTAMRGYKELGERWPTVGVQLDVARLRELELAMVRLQPAGVQMAASLERIEIEANRMGGLVDDLLTLARLDSPTKPTPEVVDLTFTMLEMMTDAQMLAPKHRWGFESGDEPVEALIDPEGVRRVMTNLLTNARRHTPEGTHVQLGVRREGDQAVLTVADDGPGLPEGVSATPGARFQNRNRSDRGSSGLGLSIVSGLVAQMCGTVDFDSSPKGLTVTVRLPLQPVSD